MNGTDRGSGRIRLENGGAGSASPAARKREPSPELEAFALLRISLDLPDEIESVSLCCEMVGSVLRGLKVDDARADEIEESVCEAASDVMDCAGDPGSGYRAAAEFFLDRVCVQILERGGTLLFAADYRFRRPIAAQADLSSLTIPDSPARGFRSPESPRRPVIGVRS
jgi:hypothetical protein